MSRRLDFRKVNERRMPIKPSKLNLWLKAFLDESNPKTFFNRTGASRAAGYQCSKEDSFRQIGSENYKKLYNVINKWLDEAGSDETALKVKLVSLLNAKKTKLIILKGKVIK